VRVTGEYDFNGELVVRNQVWEGQPGVHILTPLKISASDLKVMVDRGWIPQSDFSAGKLPEYRQNGPVTVTGIIRRSQPKADFGGGVPDPTYAPGSPRLDAVNLVNIERIQRQVEGQLLPVYILQGPDGSAQALPYRQVEMPELTEGPHMGYAIQWFTFAAILAFGYPFFVRRALTEKGPAGNGRSHVQLDDLEPLAEKERDSQNPVN
jgi:surfeit locus 1 family protein